MEPTAKHILRTPPDRTPEDQGLSTGDASSNQLRQDRGRQSTKTIAFSDPLPEPSRRLALRTAIMEGIKSTFVEALTDFIEASKDYDLTYPEKGISTPNIEFVDVEEGPDDFDRWYISTITEDEQPRIVLAKSNPFKQLVASNHAIDELVGHIYRDIHQMSANGLLRNASEEPDLRADDPIAASVHATLKLRTMEMQQTVDGALLQRQSLAPGGGGQEKCIQPVYKTVNRLRDGPDTLQRSKSLSESIVLQRLRWISIAQEQGWMMLSILANSTAFRTASFELDRLKWAALVERLDANARSLEMFAKLRGLDWKRALDISAFNDPPLTDDEVQSLLPLKRHHPHEWFLTLSGGPRPCRFRARDQIDITECDYSDAIFGVTGKRPTGWPYSWAWPSDPMILRPGTGWRCHVCKQERICCCHEYLFVNPLVELIEYPGKGIGVRTLQRIENGEYLAEYVGRYIPLDYTDPEDPKGVYHLEVDTCSDTSPSEEVPLARISAAVVGNWTRFMNHSCEPATHFGQICVGGRHRSVIRAARNIEMFEEITVDYGDTYWKESKLCQCGARSCRWSTPEAVRQSKREARLQSIPRPGSQDHDPMDIDP
ncbi:MAG: hypothetical protein M1836_004691 [Candelina mexicana]|nr:MAG: hypothetical protein M1836_004691 [Candelina mexicana]